MTNADPQKIDKWKRWVEQIESDLVHLLGSRQVYKSYGEIVRGNETVLKGGPAFHNWITDNYVTFVAMSIRRQTDTDNDVISLARLISDIRDNPESLRRDWHISFYKNMAFGVGNSVGNDTFTKNAGTGDYMDASIAQNDLDNLMTISQKVGKLANRKIAHKTTKAIPQLTFDDVDECIEGIKEIAQKYILLLTTAFNVLEPIMDDWQGIFTMKWIERE